MNKTSQSHCKYFNLNPKDCLSLSFEQSFDMLKQILSKENLKKAFDANKVYPSPILGVQNTNWCKTAKIIGINPRITETYWGIIKYAMTFPENTIHIMPLWETGDGSLYVQNSWKLNPDFFDIDLEKLGYKTCEEQLKLTVNILHALGKIVGFDTLPHVDNFSEIVILNPKFFEWIKLNAEKTEQIFDVDSNLVYKEIEGIIINFLNAPKNLFELSEYEREDIVFPDNIDKFKRRMELRKVIRNSGYEPIPVVEHAPMRPILFDKIVNQNNESWAEFRVDGKSQSAKILGSITPYKWYELDKNGYPIKNAAQSEVWDYFTCKIYDFQKKYNFDFLRADMAHNQISHSHSEEKKCDNNLEMWRYLKQKIQKIKPYFATLAEAFYNTYYINGFIDMQNKDFDIVLGNMNFENIDENYFNCIDDFLNPFRENFSFHPSVAIFTNDGDLPEHNKYSTSIKENKMRYFISLFLNLPSYMGMGFETREIEPKLPQQFSNKYVKKQKENYDFGDNFEMFEFITQIRAFYVKYRQIIENCELKLIETNSSLNLTWAYFENDKTKLLFSVDLKQSMSQDFGNNLELTYSNDGCFIYE